MKDSKVEKFKNKAFELVGNEYIFLEEYKMAREKILVEHTICNYQYYVSPSNFLGNKSKKGTRCPKCNGRINNKTTAYFINELTEKYGHGEYIVLSEYIQSEKIKIRHKCGYEFYIMPSKLLTRKICAKCNKKVHKDTDYFKKEIKDKFGNEFLVLGEYTGAKNKVKMKHNKCGSIYESHPPTILRSGTGGCPCSANNIKKDTEKFKSEVYNLSGDEYVVLGEYEGSNAKVKIKHTLCDNIYYSAPHNFLTGRRCPNKTCINDRTKICNRTNDEFKMKIHNIFSNDYEILGEYVNSSTKIKVKHNACGGIYYASPSSMLEGHGCLECYGKFQRDIEYFKNKVFEEVGDEYAVLGEYVKAREKILMKHNICKCEFMITPDSFLNKKTRCPKCHVSKGEDLIYNYLFENNYDFSTQYSFNDCRNKNPLPFDFAIFNDQNNLHCLIEYDGKQHFKSVEFFGGESSFKQRKINDSIKDEYCYINGIKLIRIPYWDFDRIDEILKIQLHKSA